MKRYKMYVIDVSRKLSSSDILVLQKACACLAFLSCRVLTGVFDSTEVLSFSSEADFDERISRQVVPEFVSVRFSPRSSPGIAGLLAGSGF